MAEVPLYRLHNPTVINGNLIDTRNGPVDIHLPTEQPRNSFEPLNEAARDAFRRRDAATLKLKDEEIKVIQGQIDEAKAAGAGEAELSGFSEVMAKLRLERARLPSRLKSVPTFGGGKPSHSLNFGVDLDAVKNVAGSEPMDPQLERLVNIAISGGAGTNDIEAIKAAFKAKPAVSLPEASAAAAPLASPDAKAAKAKDKPKGNEPRASDS